MWKSKVKELCGRSGLPAPNSPYDLPRGRKATLKVDWSDSGVRSCVKVEVDALGSPESLIVRTVSVDVKRQ